jgi:hypothetical protein
VVVGPFGCRAGTLTDINSLTGAWLDNMRFYLDKLWLPCNEFGFRRVAAVVPSLLGEAAWQIGLQRRVCKVKLVFVAWDGAVHNDLEVVVESSSKGSIIACR